LKKDHATILNNMKYLDKNSLFKTVDNVSEALLFALEIDNNEKAEIADFIINQQGKPRTYANTFAPTENDLKQDLILFTGERIKSSVGKCHMIGEEASRILRKLDLGLDKVNDALQKADSGLQMQINKVLKNPRYEYGMYCCKSCSCGLWINLASGGLNNNTEMLRAGMDYLKKHRDNKGKWKGFPYYYTLYVLNEIKLDLAFNEMKYAAQSIERRLKKKHADKNKYDLRRNYICEQILNKISRN
jgi:hypothetical protein